MSVLALPRIKCERPLDIETPISISSVVQLLSVRHAALDGVRGVLVRMKTTRVKMSVLALPRMPRREAIRH